MYNNLSPAEQGDISLSHNCKIHSNRLLLAVTWYYISYTHKKTGRHQQASFLPLCARKQGR